MNSQLSFVIWTSVVLWLSPCCAAVRSLDDIRFWVGTGDNRAALVIDWMEASDEPPALVWGYRWDGTATGQDMLKAVLTADARLYAKLGGSLANPVTVYGIGYDANDNGAFAIDDGTSFNAAGMAITSPADLAVSVDAADHYAEGWFTGFWHYGIAAESPYDGGSWSDPVHGMGSRVLTEGAWDSWTYSPSFIFAAFATNPIAALPPNSWPRDYNGDGVVNAVDYPIWRDQLSTSSVLTSTATQSVPEPGAIALAVGFVSTYLIYKSVYRRSQSSQRNKESFE